MFDRCWACRRAHELQECNQFTSQNTQSFEGEGQVTSPSSVRSLQYWALAIGEMRANQRSAQACSNSINIAIITISILAWP